MIYGVVGTLDKDTMMKFGVYNTKTGRFQRVPSKKGNGKTMVLAYYGYRENKEQGRKVFSNFHTTYSIYKPAQKIFEDLGRILDLAGKYGAYGTIRDIIKNFDRIFGQYPLTQTEQTELYEIRSLYTQYFGSLLLLTEFQKYFNSLGTTTKTIKWIEGILTQLRKLEIDAMWDAQRPVSAGNRGREYTETFLVPLKVHSDDLSPCGEDICDKDHLIYVYSDIPYREKELVILIARVVGQLYETNEIIGDELKAPCELQEEDRKKERKPRPRRIQIPAPGEEPPVITNRPPIEQEEPDEWGSEPVYAPEIPVGDMTEPGPEPKYITILGRPEPVSVKILKGAGAGEQEYNIPPDAALKMVNDLSLKSEDEQGIELLEMEMIRIAPHIPVLFKKLLPEYQKKGKVHGLFLRYFREDGTPLNVGEPPAQEEVKSHELIPGSFRASPEHLIAFQVKEVFKNVH